MARRLGVLRLPVHEALQRLRQEGFVTETGRRGLVLSPIEADFVLQLFELRAALDRIAAITAACNRRSAGEARGIAAIERERLASRNLTTVAAADQRFRTLIDQIAGNPPVAATALRNWHHVRPPSCC